MHRKYLTNKKIMSRYFNTVILLLFCVALAAQNDCNCDFSKYLHYGFPDSALSERHFYNVEAEIVDTFFCSKHYITSYLSIAGIGLRTRHYDNCRNLQVKCFPGIKNCLNVNFWTNRDKRLHLFKDRKLPWDSIVSRYQTRTLSMFSTGHDKLLFDSLAREYGDTSYCQFLMGEFSLHKQVMADSLFFAYIGHKSFIEKVKSIDVYCLTDWDSVHQAGTSLCDLVSLRIYTYQDGIADGYSYDDVATNVKLTEYSINDSRLLSAGGIDIIFDSMPVNSATQTIIVDVELEDGRRLSSTANVTFNTLNDVVIADQAE